MKLTRKISERYTWRVWFLPWYGGAVLIGVTAIFASPFVGDAMFRLLVAVPLGMGVGTSAVQVRRLVSEIGMERLRMYLPAKTEWLDETDDGQLVAVTRGNGEHLIVTMPKGYHPAQDGGLALAEAACPNMPKGLHAAWKNAAVEMGLRRLLEEEHGE